MSNPVLGTIYLLHFDRPLHHARHYLGWAEGSCIDARIAQHRSGQGARLTRAVVKAGIGLEVVRTWAGTRHDERAFKRKKNVRRTLCPACREGA